MLKRIKELNQEVLLGGIFGVIAIAAIVFEMVTADFSSESIWGGIKDIASTIVVVMVFIIAIRSFARNRPKTLEGKLNKSIDDWGNANCPLLFKVEGFQKEKDEYYEQGYSILQNQNEFLRKSIAMSDEEMELYASYRSKRTGKFVDLPSLRRMVDSNFKIRFNFIESTYGEEAANFVDETYQCINGRFKEEKFKARVIDKRHFTVEIPRISTEEQIDSFVELLDFVKLLLVIQS